MKSIIDLVIILMAIFGQTFGYPISVEENDPEQGDYFEGDIILSPEQKLAIEGNSRNGLIAERYRWPNKTILYRFADGHFDASHKHSILIGMQTIENVSCIRFIPVEITTKTGFINITSEPGCRSNVGYRRRIQNLNLSRGCFRPGTIVHELLHSVGFYHQQSAADRDEFVRIAYENISSGREHNFNKYSSSVVGDFGYAYDYGSIMHYGPKSFSKNGNNTIIPIPNPNVRIGQRDGLSWKDIQKVNAMYKCPVRPKGYFERLRL
ncbi:seminal metalloprotease 1-like [Episyrphus balteatus]|uniref:seminal metalloprotease 1-like n=1 Tax=Episyrphus balteatus TaxID=286459 RepID=UPI00248547F8|nr:seminal metalloprotease 1-like [Episyrphus balteatus]